MSTVSKINDWQGRHSKWACWAPEWLDDVQQEVGTRPPRHHSTQPTGSHRNTCQQSERVESKAG